ncbi:MAG TPA: nitrate- and nitrite sensing domain-containing protein [Actinophytocola sp.]|uniref:sensor histidine kinase n=1 Tax=Actinophytocola sp. TaxID=1872138 RepID=UPI002F941D0B
MTDNVTSTGQPGRLAALWSVLANWRDWNLPIKLAAVTLVPVVFAIVLGAMQISDQIDEAAAYRRVDRLVAVNSELRTLIQSLQRERTTGVVLIAAGAADIEPETAGERAASDAARAGFLRAAGRVTLDEEVTAAAYDDADRLLKELPGIREQVLARSIDPSTALRRYTGVIDALLRFDRTMAAEALDPRLAATSSALYELEVVREQVAFQHALIGAGIVRGGLAGPDLEALRNSARRLADSTTDFYTVAGPERRHAYDDEVSGTGIAGRNNVVSNVLATRPGVDIPANAPEWNDASKLTEDRIGDASSSLGRQLRDRSATLQDEASDGAGLAAVILLVALVVAIVVMFVVGRHLLSSLSALRRSALEVAEHRLPDAVARIRDRGDDAGPIAVEPVPVTSMDEVGQVARAFDAVQRQALRLATEQAGLRAKYSSVFVNLSRRSQGLVQRQLQLLERLERDEEDADQLATLFQLDHLATRMRRNNENLMVLSGSDVGRRNQKPASLADLLRAAVSEIEQYQRVVMLPPPSVRIVGYAVGDIVRLTAELLDNATAFSAPDTQVTIASHLFEDGSVCVAVLDEGIGMGQAELDEANDKLVDSGSIDVSTSRRMGLFVIGRLAGRHGIEVRLGGGHDVTGVRATVTVPADLATPVGTETISPAKRADTSTLSADGTPKVNGHTSGHADGSPVNGTNGLPSGFEPAPLPRRKPDVDNAADEPEHEPEHEAEPEPAAESTSGSTSDSKAAAPEDELGPLPRRTPGARMPGPAAGSPGKPFTRPGREVSPATGLFKPASRDTQNTGWWTTTGSGRPVDPWALEETTPIFDAMVSAWFRTISDKPASRKAGANGSPPSPEQDPDSAPDTAANAAPGPGEQPRPDGGWRFAADSGFDVARSVSRAEPEAFTEHGLPRRSAGRRLVPGSAGDATTGPPRPGRGAEEMRERLSDYRHGVRRARDRREGRAGGDEPDPAAPPVAQPRNPGEVDLTGAGWRFAADIGWCAANSVSTSTPVDFTSGGLPRRSAGQHLVPGGVAPAGGGPLRLDRAEELRGRLGSFQQGLSRGRRNLAERGTANGHPENEQQESE